MSILNQAGIGAPPPIAGGVDLSGIKNGPTDAEKRALRRDLEIKLGLRCPCGREMGRESYVVFVVRDDVVQGPTGPQPAMTSGTIIVCSRTCAILTELGDEAIAIRRQPNQHQVEWLGELE